MRANVTAAGVLLLTTGVLMLLSSMGLGVMVGAAGLGFLGVATNAADPLALGALGGFGVIGLALVVFATGAGGISVLAGFRAIHGDARMLRAGSLLAVGVSGLCLSTSCASCLSVGWALPLTLGLIALGLAIEMPRENRSRGTRP